MKTNYGIMKTMPFFWMCIIQIIVVGIAIVYKLIEG
jgi:hypothetical protein